MEGGAKSTPKKYGGQVVARVLLSDKPETLPYTVDPRTGCWNWRRGKARGYGVVWLGSKQVRAHRYSYEQFVGPIPPQFDVDHLCRNRRCVNPEHLEAVPEAVNTRRGLNAKLSPVQAKQIQALKGSGRSKASVGREFGIAGQHVGRIWSGRAWRDDHAAYATPKPLPVPQLGGVA